jgi:penicillin-binding protein 1A
MKSATADMPAKDFPVPPGIYTTTICLDSGKLAREDCPRTLTDIFTEATLPKEECTLNHNSSRSANDSSNRFRLDEIGQGKKGRF